MTEILELSESIIEDFRGVRKLNIWQLGINIGFQESRFQILKKICYSFFVVDYKCGCGLLRREGSQRMLNLDS